MRVLTRRIPFSKLRIRKLKIANTIRTTYGYLNLRSLIHECELNGIKYGQRECNCHVIKVDAVQNQMECGDLCRAGD